jgi:hypothetical protein
MRPYIKEVVLKEVWEDLKSCPVQDRSDKLMVAGLDWMWKGQLVRGKHKAIVVGLIKYCTARVKLRYVELL